MRSPELLPDFLRDSPTAEDEVLLEGLDALPDLLSKDAPGLEARRRLLDRVSELPLKFAPFYARLGELWDVSQNSVEATLQTARDPRAWRGAFPGIRYLDVTPGARLEGARTRLLRFSPGFRFPCHRHERSERVLVLEGSYVDSTGRVVRAGDMQSMEAGTEHAFRVSQDASCVAAIAEYGIHFTAPLLRLVARLF